MGTQQVGSLGKCKQEETLIRTSKRPKPEDSTTTESVRPTKRPKNLGYTLTNIKIANLRIS